MLILLFTLLGTMLTGCSGEVRDQGEEPDREISSQGAHKTTRTVGGSVEEAEASREARRTTRAEAQGGRAGERMPLPDAVGQMFMVSMNGTRSNYYIEKMVRERNIGGVLLLGTNMESKAQTSRLVDSLQTLSTNTEPSVPMFVAVDQEGGDISSAPWVSPQPSAAQVGDSGDPNQAQAIARLMGEQLREAGVNTDLAPVVDTGSGAAIGTRSYGNDPELVSRMAAASVEGFQKAGIVSSAKHFPNHGPATVDSHVGKPVIDHSLQKIRSYDLPPFQAAVESGGPMVMTGHLTYPVIDPNNPASLSPDAIGMLRQELGFDGVVITDDLSMGGAKQGGTTPQAAVQAVKAGADMMIVSDVPEVQAASYRAVLNAVESGEIPPQQIYDSLERITEIKEQYPLYESG